MFDASPCLHSGLTTVVGPCDPRYYCPEGSYRIDQELCPAGYYCPQGTHYPEPCRNGTWSNETGLMEVDECMPCTAGYYCNDFALTAPSGPCLAGYYCPTGSDLETEVAMPDMIVCRCVLCVHIYNKERLSYL